MAESTAIVFAYTIGFRANKLGATLRSGKYAHAMRLRGGRSFDLW